jgi:hypothetical protein
VTSYALNIKHAAWTSITLAVFSVIFPFALFRFEQLARAPGVPFSFLLGPASAAIALILAIAAVVTSSTATYRDPKNIRLSSLALATALVVAICYGILAFLVSSMGQVH